MQPTSKLTLQQSIDQQTSQYTAFWEWFANHQQAFYNTVATGNTDNIDSNFFDPLSEQLSQIRDGYYFLTGMNGDTAELIITADGEINNIVFVEDLVGEAPELPNWKFIASKPEADINSTTINIYGYTFSTENQYFYADDQPQYPDNIYITLIHPDYSEENKGQIIAGVYLFLDNLLGEVKSVSLIDSVQVLGSGEAGIDLIPIEKLNSYLEWREKEFIEKYEGIHYNTDDDYYASLTSTTGAGNPVMMMVNSGAMEWNQAASHPWILKTTISYDGSTNSGLPEPEVNMAMDRIEDLLIDGLPVDQGYVYLGRETYEGSRYVYIACQDFRQPSRVADYISNQYSSEFQIEWDIYKDKYWRSLNRFRSENWISNDNDDQDDDDK